VGTSSKSADDHYATEKHPPYKKLKSLKRYR
jgi:hypothetical protein